MILLFKFCLQWATAIDICNFTITNNKASGGETVSEIYLSYNWGDMSRICPQHLLIDNECECEDKDLLWHVSEDCHSRRGDDVRDRAQKALNVLSQHGIKPGIPDETNSNWGYGVRTIKDHITASLPRKERMGVFAYHLKRFRDMGAKYSNCFFIADGCGHDDGFGNLILPGDIVIPYGNGDDSDDSDDENEPISNGPVAYYRHPFKGNFRVDSFRTAMEIYGLTSAKDDPRAQLWFDLALQMPDAPGKNIDK